MGKLEIEAGGIFAETSRPDGIAGGVEGVSSVAGASGAQLGLVADGAAGTDYAIDDRNLASPSPKDL